jgi:hypothetical protein
MTGGSEHQLEVKHLEYAHELSCADVGDDTPLEGGNGLARQPGSLGQVRLGKASCFSRARNFDPDFG